MKGGLVAGEQVPQRNESGEMANPKRTQLSDEGETLREEPPATSQGGDPHDQDWQAAAEEVREAAEDAGKKSNQA